MLKKIKVSIYPIFVYFIELLLKYKTVRNYVYSSSMLDFFISTNPQILFEPLLRETEIEIGRQTLDLYYSHNADIPKWRYDTFYTKEPETLEWIDTFQDKDIFWDIGANVGVYSIYAAVNKKVKVYAFEPSFVNFYCLSANLVKNNLGEQVSAFPIALSRDTGIFTFNMHSLKVGQALAHFGDSIEKMPFYGQEKVNFRQSLMGYRVDDFIVNFPASTPNHIKIDVDGIEPDIIKGMLKTLKNQSLKSIQIEIDEKDKATLEQINSTLDNNGFNLFSKRHAPMFDNSDYSSVYNYLFVK